MAIFNSLGSNYNLSFAVSFLFSHGSQADTDALKKDLQNRFGKQHIELTYKGREALTLGINALKLSKGSNIGINSLTCYAVEDAVVSAGMKPVFINIEKDCLDFAYSTLTDKKLAAVIVQNTLGYPVDITTFEDFCSRNKIPLIEDVAHSLGASYADGRAVGSVGDIAMLSFGRDKTLDCVSGGAVLANVELPSPQNIVPMRVQLVDRLYPLVTWKIRTLFSIGIGKILQVISKSLGLLPKAVDWPAGNPTKLPLFYAKAILSEFRELESNLLHRKQIANIYAEMVESDLQMKLDHSGDPTHIRFPLIADNRSELFNYLAKAGFFLSDTWYDSPVAPQRFSEFSSYAKGSCATSEEIANTLVNLPTHRNINKKQAAELAERINTWHKQSK